MDVFKIGDRVRVRQECYDNTCGHGPEHAGYTDVITNIWEHMDQWGATSPDRLSVSIEGSYVSFGAACVEHIKEHVEAVPLPLPG